MFWVLSNFKCYSRFKSYFDALPTLLETPVFIQCEQKVTTRYKSVSCLSPHSHSYSFCSINIRDTFGQFLTFNISNHSLLNSLKPILINFCLLNFSVTNDSCHFKMLSFQHLLYDPQLPQSHMFL